MENARVITPHFSRYTLLCGYVMFKDPHIEAEIRFMPTDEGGRETAVKSGYRGQFHYTGESHEGWDAAQEYIGKEWVAPGESATAQLVFASPEVHCKRLVEGMTFQIQEGGQIVGLGVVKRVYPSLCLDAKKNGKAT